MSARDAINAMLKEIYVKIGWENEPSKPENIMVISKGSPVPVGFRKMTADDFAEGLLRGSNPRHKFYCGTAK